MEAILNSPKIKAKALLLEAADNVLIEAKKIWKEAGFEEKKFPDNDFGKFRQMVYELYGQSILDEYSRLENEANKKKSKDA